MNKCRTLALAVLVASIGGASFAEETRARRIKPPRQTRCEANGEGFVYVPSTDSCIRMGGSVSTQFSGSSTGAGSR